MSAKNKDVALPGPEINQAQVELDMLRQRLNNAPILTVALSIFPLNGKGSVAIGPLTHGHEIEELNVLITGLGQAQKMLTDQMADYMASERVKAMERVPSTNGKAEPKGKGGSDGS